jgi:hypothetical protein
MFMRKKQTSLFLLDTQLSYESSIYIKREIKARLGIHTKLIATDNKLPTYQQGVEAKWLFVVATSPNISNA